MTTRFYKVADHVFSVSVEEESLFDMMDNYGPFEVKPEGGDSLPVCFALEILQGRSLEAYTEDTRQDEEGQQIACGHTVDGSALFEFYLGNRNAGQLICNPDYTAARILLTGNYQKFCINNGLMVLFALATARQGTALFHGAVVSKDGKGYMFLGKSGTGKSTHARLWLQYVADTELVNDDNPVARVLPDGIWIYGSPWSGKTPCYRNVKYPLGGAVLLSQAPFNKIRALGGVEAYAAVLPSISGMRWDRNVADGLHATENALAQKMPTWYLECLPDEAAAQLCFSRIAAGIE